MVGFFLLLPLSLLGYVGWPWYLAFGVVWILSATVRRVK
jgi:hypothetical protein